MAEYLVVKLTDAAAAAALMSLCISRGLRELTMGAGDACVAFIQHHEGSTLALNPAKPEPPTGDEPVVLSGEVMDKLIEIDAPSVDGVESDPAWTPSRSSKSAKKRKHELGYTRVCEKCYLRSPNGQMLAHTIDHHYPHPVFACPQPDCGYAAKRKFSVQRHMATQRHCGEIHNRIDHELLESIRLECFPSYKRHHHDGQGTSSDGLSLAGDLTMEGVGGEQEEKDQEEEEQKEEEKQEEGDE